jgi:hypothetical protein
MNGAAEKTTIPMPRSSALNKSATVPPTPESSASHQPPASPIKADVPLFESGAAPAIPLNSRMTINVVRFWLAQQMPLKMVNRVKVMM